jgi:hypothetical protein
MCLPATLMRLAAGCWPGGSGKDHQYTAESCGYPRLPRLTSVSMVRALVRDTTMRFAGASRIVGCQHPDPVTLRER